MPWKMETLMSAREEFIALANSGAVRMSELCGRFTLSRKTGYKTLRRYAEAGADGLHDRSHRPHTCPHQTSPEMEELELRLRHDLTLRLGAMVSAAAGLQVVVIGILLASFAS